ARTVSNHKSQRRIEVGVAYQAAIGVDVLLARGLDAIKERTETGTRELVQLFVTLALGENQKAVTLRKLLERRLDAGQQCAVALEQMRADSLDLAAQTVVACKR